ncbi:MAG: hypothetical protein ACREKN_03275 [Longimicrobiaceae bacterium]
MTRKLRLDLPLLLPDVPNAKDACVARLETMVGGTPGIVHAHIVTADIPEASTLCLHYDPEMLSLSEVERHGGFRERFLMTTDRSHVRVD